MAGTTDTQGTATLQEGYQRKWRAFALRRMLALILLYGLVPFCLVLFALSRLWLHQPVASIGLIAAWVCALVAAVWWTGNFRCPRCSRRYAALGRGRKGFNPTNGLFDRVCANCQLTKFELPVQ